MKAAVCGVLLLVGLVGCGKKDRSLEHWMKADREQVRFQIAHQQMSVSVPVGLKFAPEGGADWFDEKTPEGLMFSAFQRDYHNLDELVGQELEGVPAADIKTKEALPDGGYRLVKVHSSDLQVSIFRPAAGGFMCRGHYGSGKVQNIDQGVAFLTTVCASMKPE